MNQSILYLLGNTMLRVVVMEGLETNIVNDLKKIRPTPTYYVIFADTERANQLMADVSIPIVTDSRYTAINSLVCAVDGQLDLIPCHPMHIEHNTYVKDTNAGSVFAIECPE